MNYKKTALLARQLRVLWLPCMMAMAQSWSSNHWIGSDTGALGRQLSRTLWFSCLKGAIVPPDNLYYNTITITVLSLKMHSLILYNKSEKSLNLTSDANYTEHPNMSQQWAGIRFRWLWSLLCTIMKSMYTFSNNFIQNRNVQYFSQTLPANCDSNPK